MDEPNDIPMSLPDVREEDAAAVLEVLRSGILSGGLKLAAFERAVAERVGVAHAVAVSSGTAGLHVAALAAGVGDGDVVITTPFSFVASANVALYERAVPVFVDVEPRTGNMAPDQLAEAVADLRAGGRRARAWLPPKLRDGRTRELRAIIPVHVFGQPADMDAVNEVARSAEVAVIEDACEAIGATYKGRPAGALADCGVFAFYPNKQMTTGEGGVVVTDRPDWADLFRSLRNQGRDGSGSWLSHERLGYNYRLTELGAALGLSQLSRLDGMLAARARVASWYQAEIGGIEDLELPWIAATTTLMSWFVFVIRIPLGRDGLISYLAERGIPSRSYFSPIHLQRFYVERFGYREGAFPNAEYLGRTSLALPFSGVMTAEQVGRVCAAVRECLALNPSRRGVA
jgi:dTDP-4-amino-4,6-dideoxygalactose transaminase